MAGLYKVFAMTLYNIFKSFLPQFVYPSQYSVIVGRNILHNVLNIRMVIDNAQRTHHNMIMVQFDLETTNNHVNYTFIS